MRAAIFLKLKNASGNKCKAVLLCIYFFTNLHFIEYIQTST